jgi:protein-tyrosine phosphatase
LTPVAFSILVVCTANICRSPAGQAMLAAQLAGRQVRIESAGTLALNGNAVDSTVSRLLEARGLDAMLPHRSKPIMPTMLGRFDLILCMESEHLERVLDMYPMGRGRVRLMGHWSAAQVPDPVGEADAVYSAALDLIETSAMQWAQKLKNMGMIQ